MARFKCSFSRYRNMFENADGTEDMQHIMKNTEEVKPIRKSQRSIWTTWRIIVQKLSDKAYSVLRAMAMLRPGGVGEAIVIGIVKGVTGDERDSLKGVFQKVVVEELVQGSSLISQDKRERKGREGRMYRMHGLVRRFVIIDIERGSALWKDAYSVALVSVHESVKTARKRRQVIQSVTQTYLETIMMNLWRIFWR